MKAVNLIPADRTGAQKGSSGGGGAARTGLLAGSIVLAAGVSAGMFMLVHSADTSISTRQAEVAQLDAQLAKLAARQVSSATGSTLASRLSAVTTVASQRNAWDSFLGSVSRVVPEDVWLLNLSAQMPTLPAAPVTPGTPVSATGFTVTGYTYSHPSVARLMRRLSLVPWLSDVSLVSSAKTAIANHTIYQFTVGASVVSLPEVGQ